ncbi:MAG: nitronate monooxygenase [Alphaproteobacteria bacterium]|nr:nitronate monooxygenase [Alphaproteobacteria bacterium]
MKTVNKLKISGAMVYPLIEGGKGINGTDGKSSGSWAKEGGVGTISMVSPTEISLEGTIIPEIFHEKIREKRHREMVEYAVKGGISQAKIAHDIAGNNGRIHINMLWEMADSEEVITRVLDGAKGLIHGVTCGAGLPYNLGAIASEHQVYYYPIISSARAMSILWKRSFRKYPEFLGGVVYEDPWLAGGHNGLSNAENPLQPERPYERLVELRKILKELGLADLPIIIAGGVWSLSDWQDYIDNPELGNVAFQFGTRPMITKESPISDAWKMLMMKAQKGDVILQKFSPTGFFSSAIKNSFLSNLMRRKKAEIPYSEQKTDELSLLLPISPLKAVYIRPEDKKQVEEQRNLGYSMIKETPDETLVFLTPDEWLEMQKQRAECVGCLSQCQFSSWSRANGSTGKLPDPRTYCIHNTLMNIGHGGDIDKNLAFAGHNVYRFATDPLYRHNHIPSVHELFKAILDGK